MHLLSSTLENCSFQDKLVCSSLFRSWPPQHLDFYNWSVDLIEFLYTTLRRLTGDRISTSRTTASPRSSVSDSVSLYGDQSLPPPA